MKKEVTGWRWILAVTAVVAATASFIIRAAVSGITYDEGYTYLVFVEPLCAEPSLSTVREIYDTCFANNHWLNTFLIAFFCKLTHIHYNEFIIRLPSIIFGCLYNALVLGEYRKKRLTGVQLALLCGCYYLDEFFGLARGYGMAASLVLAGLLFFKRWAEGRYENNRDGILSAGLLVMSTYANSATLVVCFCIGAVMLYRLIQHRRLASFIRHTFPLLILYLAALAVITRYHFRISGKGMPLYAAGGSSLLDIAEGYVSMVFMGDVFIRIVGVALIVLTAASIVVLIYKKKLLACDLGLAFILYFVCLMVMDLLFKRGGFQGRTLLPAYSLVILGGHELITGSARQLIDGFHLDERGLAAAKKLQKAAGIALIAAIAVFYIARIDLQRTEDWYDDYNIKTQMLCGLETVDKWHPSKDFYIYKSQWDAAFLIK